MTTSTTTGWWDIGEAVGLRPHDDSSKSHEPTSDVEQQNPRTLAYVGVRHEWVHAHFLSKEKKHRRNEEANEGLKPQFGFLVHLLRDLHGSLIEDL